MGVTTFLTAQDALRDTRRAFDGVASRYDDANDANTVIRWMRGHLLAAVRAHVPAGAHVLDLGCGPGRDAVALAREGYRVTAVDWSPEMAAETAGRVRAADLRARVTIHTLGIHQLSQLSGATFDGAYSDLGPFNCVPDLDAAAAGVHARLRPGAVLVASVIGRACPWEAALYTGRREWARATVRFASGLVPVPLEGETVWTRYYWPREFARSFTRAGFALAGWRGLGVFTPPPYLEGFAARHPRLLRALMSADDVTGAWPGVRAFGDHFLMRLVRR